LISGMSRILLVDNEASILSVLSTLLKAEGYDILAAREGDKAMELLKTEPIDLMISDIRMGPIGGMELLTFARAERRDMSVIMLTAFGTIETAIEAMKLGAFDYVTKPFKVDELFITIQRALEYKKALTENLDLKAQLKTRYRFENIVAESASMKNVCEMVERVAPTDTTVLIYGKSGTGKELVAQAIHAHSRRKNDRFLAVNCAALPEALLESEMFGHVKGAFTGASSNKKGLFEAVEGGTIFLDEIGSMPLSIQGKLLRVLQEKEIRRVGGNDDIKVNARVLAATNTLLDELMKEGKFRQDLYYRLNVIPITIEPLCNRKEDIMPLAYHIIRREVGPNAELPKVSPGTQEVLENYSWPGNVRELENAMKHAITFATDNQITASVLPPKIVSAVGDVRMPGGEEGDEFRFRSLRVFLRSKEQEYLQQVIKAVGGDKEKAADALKISLATLYRKLPKSERPKDFKDDEAEE
jgi:two-component system response regulator PilR (NtrC family)